MDTKIKNDSKEIARLLKALSVETRVRIIELLKGRVLCVGALASRLGVTQGAVSQHLRILRDAGLVDDEKRGYYVHYRLNEQALARWRAQIDTLLDPAHECCAHAKGAKSCPAATKKIKAARNPKT